MSEEKLPAAVFGQDEPQPKSLRFSIGLEGVVVDVAIKKVGRAVDKGGRLACSGGPQVQRLP